MVLDTNTVIDPRAVMVKSVNTTLTHTAMPRARSPYDQAIRTQLPQVLIDFQ